MITNALIIQCDKCQRQASQPMDSDIPITLVKFRDRGWITKAKHDFCSQLCQNEFAQQQTQQELSIPTAPKKDS